MKYNHKQLAYSVRKINQSKFGLLLRMFSFAMLLFFTVSAVNTVADPSNMKPTMQMGMGVLILLTMANIGNITQPNDRETSGNQLSFQLWLTARDQVDTTVAFPMPNAAREIASTPLKVGEVQHKFEGVENSLKYAATGEHGDITSTFANTMTIIIRYSIASLNFLDEYQGKGFILNYKECEDPLIYQLGTYEKALILKSHEVKKDKDGKYISLTFANEHWRKEMILTGPLTLAAPVVFGAGVTNLAVANGVDTYQLTNGAAVIATVGGLAEADHGRYITVKASAADGVAPTIADNAVFVLVDGETWTANPGSQITFMVLDSGTLIEMNRIQTA